MFSPQPNSEDESLQQSWAEWEEERRQDSLDWELLESEGRRFDSLEIQEAQRVASQARTIQEEEQIRQIRHLEDQLRESHRHAEQQQRMEIHRLWEEADLQLQENPIVANRTILQHALRHGILRQSHSQNHNSTLSYDSDGFSIHDESALVSSHGYHDDDHDEDEGYHDYDDHDEDEADDDDEDYDDDNDYDCDDDYDCYNDYDCDDDHDDEYEYDDPSY